MEAFHLGSAGAAAAQCWSDFEEIPHIQGQRSPSKTVGGAKLCLDSNPIPARDTQKSQTSLVHTKAPSRGGGWSRRDPRGPWQVHLSICPLCGFSFCALWEELARGGIFFFAAFASVENFLLAAMAYDRHATVCEPLRYTITMKTSVCARLAVGSYICGFVNASIHVGGTFSLSLCKSKVVHHFFCDIPAVTALSCSDKHIREVVLILISSFNVFFALLVIFISYLLIFITVLKMHSAKGYQKALST